MLFKLARVVVAVAVSLTMAGMVATRASATSIFVDSTGDDTWDGTAGFCETAAANGICTLRAAIQYANATPGTVIGFNVSGPGVHAIAPATPLPPLTAPMTIDATTQPGYAGAPLIELSGSSSATVASGLWLDAGSSPSTVRGLALGHWGEDGIRIFTSGNTIAGNYIGVDPTGATAAGNAEQGVLVYDGSANIIGGTRAADRNVISGNGEDGVQIQKDSPGGSTPAEKNVVEGNYIGTNAAATAAVPNQLDGVSMVLGAQNNTVGGAAPGAGNVISGNGRAGITAFDTSTGNLIEGNYIGTNPAGSSAIAGQPNCGVGLSSASNTLGGTSATARNVISGNSGCGVFIGAQAAQVGASGSNVVEGNYIGTNAAGTSAVPNGTAQSGNQAGIAIQAPGNQIGGTAAGAGNVISGNIGPGVAFDGSVPAGVSANLVAGNLIGTDARGAAPLGNTSDGVQIYNAAGNTVGGTVAAARNVISGNGANGVVIGGANGNLLQGNAIGTDATGTVAIGNQRSGVAISSSNNTVGGTITGAGNVIADNGRSGVVVTAGNGNAIEGNSIHGDAGIGIDLGDDGVTPNADMSRSGPNNLQNFPLLSTVSPSGSRTTVSGSLHAAPGTAFRIELFANSACGHSTQGEGQTFLGASTTTTSSAGSASFSAEAATPPTGQRYVTATATDPAGNTSEFSSCARVPIPAKTPARLTKVSTARLPSGVALTLICDQASGESCTGEVRLSVRVSKRGKTITAVSAGKVTARTRTAPLTVGRATYRVAPGARKTIKVPLNATGRKLLGRFHRLPVRVAVTLKTSAGTKQIASRKITLKTTRRR